MVDLTADPAPNSTQRTGSLGVLEPFLSTPQWASKDRSPFLALARMGRETVPQPPSSAEIIGTPARSAALLMEPAFSMGFTTTE